MRIEKLTFIHQGSVYTVIPGPAFNQHKAVQEYGRTYRVLNTLARDFLDSNNTGDRYIEAVIKLPVIGAHPNLLYPRRCDFTGMGMHSGYCFEDGAYYMREGDNAVERQISHALLVQHLMTRDVHKDIFEPEGMTYEEYENAILDEAIENDLYYYTEWEIDGEDEVYDYYGNPYRLNVDTGRYEYDGDAVEGELDAYVVYTKTECNAAM